MRKFIIELIISVVLITVGVSMCFFEFSDYDYVPYNEHVKNETITYTVSKDHPLRLEVDDDLNLRYEYDEDMKERVKIEFSSLLPYKEKDDSLKIKDADWHWNSWKPYYQAFVDGLKNHEITIFHEMDFYDYEEVTIICSRENRENIDIRY